MKESLKRCSHKMTQNIFVTDKLEPVQSYLSVKIKNSRCRLASGLSGHLWMKFLLFMILITLKLLFMWYIL